MLAWRQNGENTADFAQALLDASEAHLKRLLRETDRLVVTRWTTVVAVAAALLARKFLSALELHKIIVAAR